MYGQQIQRFDYIVVGGGTARSVVAARLAEQPSTTVCLIEAGPSDAGRPDILAIKNQKRCHLTAARSYVSFWSRAF